MKSISNAPEYAGGEIKTHTISGSISAMQCGNVVSIQGYTTAFTSIAANAYTKMGNIGDLLRPKDTIRATCVICEHAYDNGDIGYFVVGTDGDVYFTAPTTRTNYAIRVSCTYISE